MLEVRFHDTAVAFPFFKGTINEVIRHGFESKTDWGQPPRHYRFTLVDGQGVKVMEHASQVNGERLCLNGDVIEVEPLEEARPA